jgi:N-acetylglucosaminyldiphosphoundecaprenol N-acetyl-beta-D-mannosaminyltransferase
LNHFISYLYDPLCKIKARLAKDILMRILLVQLADIGDLILTTPALHALREAQPDAHLTLLTTRHAAPIVENTGLVDEITTFEQSAFDRATALFRPTNLRRVFGLGHYDTVVYFHHFTLKMGTLKYALIALATGAKRRIGLDNGNGWFLNERLPDGGFGAQHQAQYWLDLVGLLGADSTPRPAVVAQEPFSLPAHAGKRIVIHAGSGAYNTARRWEPEHFAAVADALHRDYGAQIVLVGGPGDDSAAVKAAMQTQPLDLTGQTTLPQLASVIAQADMFIGAESGVMHLAAAAGTRVIALFGPGNPEAWGPWTRTGQPIILRSAPECSPCSYVGHGIGLRDGCRARTCMRMITPAQVAQAAQILLENPSVQAHNDAPPPRQKPAFANRIRILGLPVDAITYGEWLSLIAQWVSEPDAHQPHHVCTINPEFIMIAQDDLNFRHILSRADLCVPDGVGLLWAAKHLGTPLPQRVTGSDGVPIIAERAAQEGWRLFFLGAAPGVADTAADVLRAKHPGLQIVGTYSGSPAPEEEDALVERVNASRADILFVAYGAPEQDKWIARNLPRLRVHMAMGVGGSLDFVAGVVPRAPQWMQRLGLEWLFRLYLQPWRLRRMLRLPRFVLAVLLRGRN